MESEQREQLVEELMQLIQDPFQATRPPVGDGAANARMAELHDMRQAMLRKTMKNLYLKHLDDELLSSMHEFYTSPVGKRMVETQLTVIREFTALMPELLRQFDRDANSGRSAVDGANTLRIEPRTGPLTPEQRAMLKKHGADEE